MRPFLDSGLLLTLLFRTSDSPVAWEIARRLEGPLMLAWLQVFTIENRLQREIEADESTPAQRAVAAASLQRFRWYFDQHVFHTVPLDCDIAVQLAIQWQKGATKTLPAMLLLWPALATTAGATHFLSLDPRTRRLARAAGLRLLPEQL